MAEELFELGDEVGNKVEKSTLKEELESRHSDMSGKMVKDLMKLKRDMEKYFKEELRRMKTDYKTQIKRVRSGWIGAFGNMKDAVKHVCSDLRSLIDQMEVDNRRAVTLSGPPTTSNPIDLTKIHKDIDRLQDRIGKIQTEMSNLGGESPEVISYQSLGFRNPEEANSWIEEHCPHGKYGLIVGFHIMMEHVEQKIKGVDALARLKKVHKIKLPLNSEAVAIALFQSMIPRFFCKQGDHKVIDSTESYFTNIKSFADWNNLASGFKVKLKKQMERFRKHQLATIRDKLDPSS